MADSIAESECDAVRDAYLKAHGFRVLRFWNNDIFDNEEGVLTSILDALQAPLPARLRRAPPPPLKGEGRIGANMPDTYDLIVLGSGPGGYVAAIRAAQLGLKTAIIERELLGGICLNWGCIPTKALLRSAEIFHYLQHADAYGLSAGKPSFDIAKVVARSRAVAKQFNQGVAHLMKKNKIAVVMGEGKLTGKGKLAVDRRRRQGDRARRQAHHRRDRRAGARAAVRTSLTANASGPTATR